MLNTENRDLGTWLPAAAAALIALTAAAPAEAALRYRFEFEGGSSGTVWADGARCRVEFAPAEPVEPATAAEAVETVKALLYDLILDDGTQRLYAHSAGKTWWNASEHEGLPVREKPSLPFVMIASWERSVLEPSVQVTEEAYAEPIAGLPTRKFVIRIRYRLEHEFPNEVVHTTVSGIWLLWTTEALEGRPCGIDPRALSTRIDEIDALLQPELEKIPGFPIMRQLSVTHRIHGGASKTGIETLTLDGFETVEPPGSLFAVPAGYRHQAPVFSGLAVQERVLPGSDEPPP